MGPRVLCQQPADWFSPDLTTTQAEFDHVKRGLQADEEERAAEEVRPARLRRPHRRRQRCAAAWCRGGGARGGGAAPCVRAARGLRPALPHGTRARVSRRPAPRAAPSPAGRSCALRPTDAPTLPVAGRPAPCSAPGAAAPQLLAQLSADRPRRLPLAPTSATQAGPLLCTRGGRSTGADHSRAACTAPSLPHRRPTPCFTSRAPPRTRSARWRVGARLCARAARAARTARPPPFVCSRDALAGWATPGREARAGGWAGLVEARRPNCPAPLFVAWLPDWRATCV